MAGGLGNDLIYGNDCNDILRSDINSRAFGVAVSGNDTIYGGSGNDQIGGKGSNNYLDGGEDNNSFWGNEGNNTLLSGNGNDILDASGYIGFLGNTDYSTGDNSLLGDIGDDYLNVFASATTIP